MFKAPTYLLAACSGNPFDPATDGSTDGSTPPPTTTPPTTDPITGGGDLPPGTTNPTPNTSILRYEARGTGDDEGNGYANGFAYDSATDTFSVQGLAFDGDQPGGTPFARDLDVALGTGFAAYEGPPTVPDFVTGDPIGQLTHRAVYGVSTSGRTQLAIVRTGSYTGYGFGGYVYQRNQLNNSNVGVVLPTQGQATYSGPYAGLRDFNGTGGLQYVTGLARVNIDFDGFSGNCSATRCTDAVRGEISDRQIFSLAGANITDSIITAINTEEEASLTSLPVLRFRIGTGVLDANGEIQGTLDSNFANNEGRTIAYEEGNYYAIMAGDHTTAPGGEIVGIIVVEGQNRSAPGSTFRETGGFIVERGAPTP